MVLLKGFEIEMYTGTPQGEIVGLSDKIVAALDGFMREPDSRNVEYITQPSHNYDNLLCALLRPRRELRSYLNRLGDYTLIPGSTLSLGGGDRFQRSDPANTYHDYIENTYGTKVVTASVHINIGISDPEVLMRACRAIRMEAPLFLALSASSPFLDGKTTGYHSTRWGLFPQTPNHVPLFASHADHIQWVEDQLVAGTMQNVRHLWTSVRPNGDRRPYDLNRLELRICDLVTDPIALLAITALLEARLLQIIENPSIDPLTQSIFSGEELVTLTAENEAAAAAASLDAPLRHWEDGRTILARDWISEMYQDVWAIAKQQGFSCFLSPLHKILREGNEAQQWLQLHTVGFDTQRVVSQAILATQEREMELEDKLCSFLLT
ncbi:glutamate--cysteine ligase [Nostoc sp. 'Peltigera membranacea cyanobiont' N6]|uniref:glutamate--cysteine ligase n=1 Tax=Nostoc sp. 'Peltigera membranacea cyanobiont' N6 TaxID=1261031 RepID=UPI000CF31EF4|nr:glutamate--cysteine ligase [Nostoc sp. 'Peltigera membranacea cyanobiont' N6]AVH67186.1 glutamate-cysteine ligase [Nostoc sp. 'Peltigera membranacea cyanobiont' N6]